LTDFLQLAQLYISLGRRRCASSIGAGRWCLASFLISQTRGGKAPGDIALLTHSQSHPSRWTRFLFVSARKITFLTTFCAELLILGKKSPTVEENYGENGQIQLIFFAKISNTKIFLPHQKWY
jgi:hypothetical protein